MLYGRKYPQLHRLLPEGKVAVINGLKEYIVVDTEDVLLICPRSEEQNIKKFIDEVKYNEGDKHI